MADGQVVLFPDWRQWEWCVQVPLRTVSLSDDQLTRFRKPPQTLSVCEVELSQHPLSAPAQRFCSLAPPSHRLLVGSLLPTNRFCRF